ncbi:MAG TPA: hypothetical protein QGF58_22195 [Myxococcota bacterium]|nr:hypothetical protein [Myxococcota bacterium]
MRTFEIATFGTLIISLAATTGCTFVGGALVGNGLWGDQQIFPGEPGVVSSMNGTSAVCLGADTDVEPTDEYFIRGRVVSSDWSEDQVPGFDNLVGCQNDVQQTLVIEDGDGVEWTIGYAWIEGDWDSTPTVWADRGQQVEVLVRNPEGSSAAGMVVYDGEGALYALESGIGGPALQNGDIGGLDVEDGDVVGNGSGDCGETESISVIFESDQDRLVMYAGEDRGMEVDDDYLTVCTIESVRYVEGDCEDDAGETSWVVFR